MDIALLRTFLAVYRAGSLTGAAPHLGLSQPTVTAHIQALEAELGQQLFQRRPRGVLATTVAEELAGQIAGHVDALTAIAGRALPGARARTRPVHLAGPAELIAALVLPALAGPLAAGLRLRVTTGLADELLTGLAEGRFDLVVSTIRPRDRAISAIPFLDEEFVLVAAPATADRIDADRLATDPAGVLRDLPLVAYAEDLPIIRRYWRSVFGVKPAQPAAVVVPDLRAVLAVTAAGTGITVLPGYLCAAELAEGRLVAVLHPEVPPINTIYLATRAGTAELPHIAAVRERLLSELG